MREYHQPRFELPDGACLIHLIRHGQTEPAREGAPFPLKDGHGDPALLPIGHAQAEAVAAAMAQTSLAALYVTTLHRTHQTAAPLAALTGLIPSEVADLREMHLGDWEGGLYRVNMAKGHPAALRVRARQEMGEIPGAETGAALRARVMGALHDIARQHPDAEVAAVVHGGVIGAALAAITGAAPMAFARSENGSISRIVLGADHASLRGFNDISHLTGL